MTYYGSGGRSALFEAAEDVVAFTNKLEAAVANNLEAKEVESINIVQNVQLLYCIVRPM